MDLHHEASIHRGRDAAEHLGNYPLGRGIAWPWPAGCLIKVQPAVDLDHNRIDLGVTYEDAGHQHPCKWRIFGP